MTPRELAEGLGVPAQGYAAIGLFLAAGIVASLGWTILTCGLFASGAFLTFETARRQRRGEW